MSLDPYTSRLDRWRCCRPLVMRVLVVVIVSALAGASNFPNETISLFSPCPPATNCNVASDFEAGCVASGGGAFKANGLPVCALRAPAVQLAQCGGVSCFTTGAANFTAGCARLHGFVSGTESGGAPMFCVAATAATLFTACPPGASVCQLEPGFESACATLLGGFIDAYIGPAYGTVPQCAAFATTLRSCPAGTTVCNVDAGFIAKCTAVGGYFAGTADGAPMCILPGAWSTFMPCDGQSSGGGCSYDSASFGAACAALGGFITATADGLSVCAAVAGAAFSAA